MLNKSKFSQIQQLSKLLINLWTSWKVHSFKNFQKLSKTAKHIQEIWKCSNSSQFQAFNNFQKLWKLVWKKYKFSFLFQHLGTWKAGDLGPSWPQDLGTSGPGETSYFFQRFPSFKKQQLSKTFSGAPRTGVQPPPKKIDTWGPGRLGTWRPRGLGTSGPRGLVKLI